MRRPNEDLVREISGMRGEPAWMLDIRLSALDAWRNMSEPHWAEIDFEPIDYDGLNYFNNPAPVDNSDLAETYKKMGLPIEEQKALLGMATDTIVDSRSVNITLAAELSKMGIVFMPFSEAARKRPDLIKKYFCSAIPANDNFFAALNTAVFSDGTFIYVPPSVKCPVDLASYFRIETAGIGQFERTLIIADDGAELSYLEGCSAPRRPNHQLHSGVVEVVALSGSAVKYATVQNWAPNILNFVSKRAVVHENAKMYWTQVEVGSAKTWKYPSSILSGRGAFSDFFSLSITRGTQRADTGTRMIHNAPGTKSNIVSFGVALGHSRQTFRSKVAFNAPLCANASKCDSKIIGGSAAANTLPSFSTGDGGDYSHEAQTGALDPAALLYLALAGIGQDEASALLIAGIAAPVVSRLPMEFLVESRKLIESVICDK